MSSMDSVLKSYFGYSSLKRYQEEVINQVLSDRDALVVMATGSGKSICYQLPPLLTGKTALVISPLLSLMQDQVMSLKQKGIKADYLGSTQKNSNVLSQAEKGKYELIYMTPERAALLPSRFWSNLIEKGICLLAVDEAHCISEWGHDFRLEYKKLNLLRDKLGGVPFLALTATATQRVRDDISSSLQLASPFIYIGSFDRPNIFYGVKYCDCPDVFLSELIKFLGGKQNDKGSTIVYCTTIGDVEKIHCTICSNGINAGMYHGQMKSEEREQAHRAFVSDKKRVMVATIAFGMGIDKPDVRCVIHYGCPRSLESYYQESGRCGRDGLPSVCWLYYRRLDFTRASFYWSDISSEEQKIAIMKSFSFSKNYCTISSCRRQNLLRYFGEYSGPSCGNCDNCTCSPIFEMDLSKETWYLLSCIKDTGCRFGLNLPIDVLRGSNAHRITRNSYHHHPYHGIGKDRTQHWWKAFGSLLITKDFLMETINGSYRQVKLTEKGAALLSTGLSPNNPLIFRLSKEMIEHSDGASSSDGTQPFESNYPTDEVSLTQEEKDLYQMLITVRSKLAQDKAVAPYAVCSDNVLRNLSTIRPSNKESMCLVDGVSTVFVQKFGVIFQHYINKKSTELSLQQDQFEGGVLISIDDNSDDGDNEQLNYNSLASTVLELVTSYKGIKLDEILFRIPDASTSSVQQVLEELQESYDVYMKKGLYYPL